MLTSYYTICMFFFYFMAFHLFFNLARWFSRWSFLLLLFCFKNNNSSNRYTTHINTKIALLHKLFLLFHLKSKRIEMENKKNKWERHTQKKGSSSNINKAKTETIYAHRYFDRNSSYKTFFKQFGTFCGFYSVVNWFCSCKNHWTISISLLLYL